MVLMPLVALELLLLFALYLILRVDVVLWTISILTALHECGSMVVGLALMSMSSLISFAIGSASGRLSARAMPLSKLQGSSPISLALSVHVHCIRLYGGKNKYLLKLKISPVVARSGKSTDGPPSRSFQKLFAYVSDIEATHCLQGCNTPRLVQCTGALSNIRDFCARNTTSADMRNS